MTEKTTMLTETGKLIEVSIGDDLEFMDSTEIVGIRVAGFIGMSAFGLDEDGTRRTVRSGQILDLD